MFLQSRRGVSPRRTHPEMIAQAHLLLKLFQVVHCNSGSEKQQTPEYGPDPVGGHQPVYSRQLLAAFAEFSVAWYGKTEGGQPDQNNRYNAPPSNLTLKEQQSFYSCLDQHQRTDNQRYQECVTNMPLDEIFLFRVAKRGIDDELNDPDQNKESTVNNDLYSELIHGTSLQSNYSRRSNRSITIIAPTVTAATDCPGKMESPTKEQFFNPNSCCRGGKSLS